ncbi:MAG: cell wall-active antibiotics response protein [Candidatus Saccharibacteria bacterium]|nr:cell wall-active antibiotics response protein [Candidatus Saccharibacteria bacterium]
MKHIKPIIWGVAIIALGVIFGGNALGLFDINIFFNGWWTLFIIVPSVIGLITEKEKFSSLAFLIAGILLLLAAQDVFSYEVAWKAILAVVLILVGIFIIFKSIAHSDNAKEVEKKVNESKDDKKMDSQIAVFSGNDRAYNNETFQGSNLTAIFGGVELDLRNAKFTKDTVIKAFALFGGIDIIVPEDVQIKIKSGFIFGGISDDRKSTSTKGKYTIYLDAAGGFGGVSIAEFKKH